jgi:glycosyltransferase involved in cell wall biosynthesis
MVKVSALLCVYNDKLFIKECLENTLPLVDEIIIVEGSWSGEFSTYDYKKNENSTDGTYEICLEYQKRNPEKVKVFSSIGDECCSRNLGLANCSHKWVLQRDSDEAFHELEFLEFLYNILPKLEDNIDIIELPEYQFYFNFQNYMLASRKRMFRGDRVSYSTGHYVGDGLVPSKGNKVLKVESPWLFHYQWIMKRQKVINSKAHDMQVEGCKRAGLDPEIALKESGYKYWLENIYLKFDGTNLKELEEKNGGSIHIWAKAHKEVNDPMYQINDLFAFPLSTLKAPWFNKEEKGILNIG